MYWVNSGEILGDFISFPESIVGFVEATPEAGNDRSYEGENPPVVHIRNPCIDFPGEIYQSPFNHCPVYLALYVHW